MGPEEGWVETERALASWEWTCLLVLGRLKHLLGYIEKLFWQRSELWWCEDKKLST